MNDNKKETLDQFLSSDNIIKLTNLYSSKQKNDEIEFRIGKFIDNKFDPNLNQQIFDEYKLKLDTINKTVINERSVVFNGSFGIRKIIYLTDANKSKKNIQEKKEKLDTINIPNLGIRINRSSEIENNQNVKFNSIQYKIRDSFISNDKNWRYDFTKVAIYNIENENTINNLVNSGDLYSNDQNFNFILEFELINNNLTINEFLNSFTNQLAFIRKSNNEIFNKMYNLFNYNIKFNYDFNDFINKPITMQLIDIRKLETEEYSVTEKADGLRTLLFIDEHSKCFLLNNISIIPIAVKTNLINVLVDGEYINNDLFLAFDIMSFNKDISKLNLRQRYNYLQDFIKKFNNNKFILKNQLMVESVNPEQIYKLSNKVLDSKYNYSIDGLIFTPINQNYFNFPNTLKWKTQDDTTIDFLIRKNKEFPDEIEYHLYVGINQGEFNKLNLQKSRDYPILFPNIKSNTNFFPILFNPIDLGKDLYKIVLPKKLNIPDNVIVELFYKDFKWNFRNVRDDKTNQYKKYNNIFGNNWKSAYTNMQVIINPITEEIIRGKVKPPFFLPKANEDSLIKPLRKFHNSIKKMLYDKYFKNKDWVLEVAAGRLGDIHKLINNNVKNVVGFDKDSDAVQESKIRLENIDLKNTNVYLGVADANNEWITIIKNIIELEEVPQFDVVSIQFAIHFFLGDQTSLINLINNVNSIIKVGGYFIATGLDAVLVKTLLDTNKIAKGQTLDLKKDDKTIISIKRDSVLDKISNLGQEISVYLDSIGSFHQEYLINFDYVSKEFQKNGFKVIKSEYFKKFYDPVYELSNAEKKYSFLGRFVVFKKN